MAKINRILLISIFVLALAAAALSFVLFQRRHEFRDRADKLAVTVTKMVKSLDEGSGTDVASSVYFKPADPDAGTPESGPLGWKAYHESPDNFDGALGKARTLADDIAQQKNFLAERLAEVATQLGVPPDATKPEDLKNANQYKTAAEMIASWSKAVAKRDSALIDAVANAARSIGHPIQPDAFKKPAVKTDENGQQVVGDFPVSQDLNQFKNAVVKLHTRCKDYGAMLSNAVKEIGKYPWSITAQQILDENRYSDALSAMLNDFRGINEKLVLLERTQAQLDEVKVKLQAKIAELDDLQKQRDDLKGQLAKAAKENKKLKAMLGIGGSEAVAEGQLDPNLQGKVIEVNPEWNYVIINLGRNKIREGVPLLAARGNEFVAKLRVSRVLKHISIAEILPDPRPGTIRKGDRVILSADVVSVAAGGAGNAQ